MKNYWGSIYFLIIALLVSYRTQTFSQGIPIANPVARCGAGVVTITAQMGDPPGTELRLYDAQVGGNLITTSNTSPYNLTIPNVATTTTFWLESYNAQTNSSSERISVQVTIHPIPGIPANKDTTVCEITQNLIQLVGTFNLYIFGWMGSPPGNQMRLYTQPQNDPVYKIADFYPTPPSLPIPVPVNIPPNSYIFELPPTNVSTTYWVTSYDSNTGCESPRKQFRVNVIPAPPAVSISSKVRCGSGPLSFTFMLTGVPPFPIHLGFVSALPITGIPTPYPIEVNEPYIIEINNLITSRNYVFAILNPETDCFNVTPFSATVTPIPAPPVASGFCVSTGTSANISVTMGNPAGQRVELYTSNIPPLLPIATDETAPYELTTPPVTTNSTFFVAAVSDPGECRSTLVPVPITVPPLPVAVNATRCGSGLITLTATTSGNFTPRWYDSLTSSQPIFSGNQLVINNLSTTTTYYVSSFNGQGAGCEGNRAAVVANVLQVPDPPISSNVAACVNSTATFTVTPVGTITGVRLFTQISGGNPIASDNTPPFLLSTPVVTTTTTFYIESFNAMGAINCPSASRTEVVVNILSQLAPPVVVNAVACKDSVGSIAINMGSPAGDGVHLYTSASGGVPIATVSSPPYILKTPSPITTNTTFWVEAFSNQPGCASSSRVPAAVTVTSTPSPPSSVLISRCGSGQVTFTLSNSTSDYCIFLYSTLQGGTPVYSDCANPFKYTLSVTTTTTFYARYNHFLANCPSNAGTVLINVSPTINQPPVPFDTARCGNGNLTFRAALGNSQGNQIAWFAQPTGGSPIHQGFNFTISNLQKDTILYIAAINANCEGPRVPIRAKIIRPPTAQNITGCMNSINTFTASVHANGGHIISLYSLPNGGMPISRDTVLPPPNPNLLFLPFQSGSQSVVTYYIEAYDTMIKCTTARVPVVATLNPTPPVPIAKVDSICGVGNYHLVLTFSPPPNTDLITRLYTQPHGGSPISTDGIAPYEFKLNNITTTTTFYVATFSPFTSCLSSVRIPMIIRVNSLPGLANSDTVKRCGPGTVTFSVNVPNPARQGVRLYKAPSGGNPVATDAQTPYFLNSDSIFTTTTYYIETYDLITGCASASRVPVVAKLIELPEPPSVQNLSSCEPGIFTFTATIPNPQNHVVTMFSTQGSLTPLSSDDTYEFELTTPVVSQTRSFFFEVKDINTGCLSPRKEAQVIILNKPGLPTALDVARCGDGIVTFSAIMGTPAGSMMRLFTSPNANTPIATDNTQPYLLETPPITVTTSFYLEVIDEATGCKSPRLTLRATKSSPPFPPSISATSRCGPGRLTFTIFPGSSEEVFIAVHSHPSQNSVVTQLLTQPFLFVTPLLTSTSTFYVESVSKFSGCPSARRELVAVINPLPIEPQAPDVWRCGKGEVTFTFTMGTPAGDKIYLYEDLFSVTPIDSVTGPTYHIKTPTIITHTTYYAAAYNSATRCAGGRQKVIARVEPVPAPPTISNVTKCEAGVVCFTAYMNTPEGNEIRLYDSEAMASIVAVDNSSPYELCTQTLTTQTQFFAQVVNTQTGCTSSRVRAVARIASKPGIPTALDVQRCGQGPVTFTAQMGSPAGSKIVIFASDTTQAPVVETANSPYLLTLPIVSTSSAFYLQSIEQTTGCASDKIEVRVTIFPNPGPPHASPLSRCGAGELTITVDMTNTAANVVRLYTSSGIENAIAEVKNPPYLIRLNNVTHSTTYYIRSINESNNCSSPDYPVIIDINPVPAIPQAITNVICGFERATITAIMGTPGGTEIRLYDTELRQNIVASINRSPFTLETPILSSSTTFYMEVVNSVTGCVSPLQSVPITVNPKPGTPTAFDALRCGAGNLLFSANMTSPSGTALELFYDLEGGVPIVSDSSAPYVLQTPFITTNTTYFLQSTDKLTGCRSNRLPVQAVVVTPPGTPPPIIIERCGPGIISFTAEMGNPSGNVLRIYDQEEGGVIIAEASDNPYAFTFSITTSVTYYLGSSNTLFDCHSKRTPVIIKINPIPAPPIVAPLKRCGPGNLTFTAYMGSPKGTQIRFFDTNYNLIAVDALEPYVFTSPLVINTTNFLFDVFDENTGCASNPLYQTFEILSLPGIH
ncbi:MAG: hypothetical protein NZ576_07380, partial [Bacteroidia bacterium]|nr:hypothetical protein [Bacteroidia bacterium]